MRINLPTFSTVRLSYQYILLTSPSLAQITLVSQTVCRSRYSEVARKHNVNITITSNMLCAGTEKVDACTGDSGSPIMMRDDLGRWAAVGIVSFGPTLCGSIPGVVTKVQNYLPWIKSVIS